MPGDIEIKLEGLDEFIAKMNEAAKGGFKQQLAVWLEAMGFEFLSIIQDEIIRKRVVDTRLLLNSFEKGANDGVFKKSHGGLTLEVGTNVKYAKYVNDGHWLNPQGQDRRFVPGVFEGDKFRYQPGARTGMVLKQQYIQGTHYWESALEIFQSIFNRSLERKLQEWLNSYF